MFYVRSVESAQAEVLKTIRERSGKEGWAELVWPDITLFLAGMLVSGRPISESAYLKRVRDHIESAAPSDQHDPTAIDVRESMSIIFADFSTTDEDPEEDTEPERIHLLDVTVLIGDRQVSLPQTAIELRAVSGWTFGRLFLPS